MWGFSGISMGFTWDLPYDSIDIYLQCGGLVGFPWDLHGIYHMIV